MGTKGIVFKHGGMNGHNKTRNGWYLELVVLVSSIVGLLMILLECAESLIHRMIKI